MAYDVPYCIRSNRRISLVGFTDEDCTDWDWEMADHLEAIEAEDPEFVARVIDFSTVLDPVLPEAPRKRAAEDC